MSRILIFALTVVFAFTTSRASAQTAVLVVTSATIAETKANGAAWDFPLVGKKALPDPFVKIWVFDPDGAQADYGETDVRWDTLYPVWNREIARVKSGQRLKIEVWDKDVKYDDLIGRHYHTLTSANCEAGCFELKFDQVRRLRLFVRANANTPSESRITLMQPYPGPNSANRLVRTKDQRRAIVLLHGLDLRDDGASAGTPRFAFWQGSTSPVVTKLSRHADVFSIAYAQNNAVEEIASYPELRDAVGKIKDLGYSEVVLLGHSAGGLLARHFVEEHPRAGVTRVVQIAAPNGGTKLATWAVRLLQVPREQASFVASLSPAHRNAVLKSRQSKSIPASIEFVSVVTCTSPKNNGDGAVNRQCQWPADLQSQGIPCVCVQGSHMEVLSDETCLDTYCKLAAEPQPRWGQTQVQQALR